MPKRNKMLSGYSLPLLVYLFLSTLTGSAQLRPRQIAPSKFLSLQSRLADSSGPKVTLARLPENAGLSRTISRLDESGPACQTTTFYMHLSAPAGQEIKIKEVQTLPNGNFILTGNTGLPNTGKEGFISLMTNAGALVSQQRIRINNSPVLLWATKVLLNGKIAISGIMNDGSNQVFIAQLNEDISPGWVQLYQMPSAPVKTTLEITEAGSYALAVQLSSSLIYALLTKNGSLTWTGQLYPEGLVELVGFSEIAYSEYGLVTNCIRDGKKAVNFFRINPEGTAMSNHWVGKGTEEYSFGDIKTFNQTVKTVGILKDDAGFHLVRDIFRPEKVIETEHTYTLRLDINFNTSAAFDNAGDVMGFCFPQEGKMVFIRQFAYYQTLPEYSRQYEVPPGASMAGVARSLKDGGYLFALNTADSKEIILVKTDSIGLIADCNSQSIANEFSEIIYKENTLASAVNNPVDIAFSGGALTRQPVTFEPVFDCHKNYCPEPPVEDTCLSSYYKTYRTNGYSESFGNYLLMHNNRQVVSGSKLDRVLNNRAVQTTWIKFLDEKGNVVKGVNVFIDGISTSFDLKKVDAHHFMMISQSTRDETLFYNFTLLNDQLEIIWSKSYTGFENYFQSRIDLVMDVEGNFYFTTINLGFNSKPGLLVFKMNASGDPSWVKVYEARDFIFIDVAATTTPSSFIALIEGGNGTNLTVQLNKTTGEMLNTHSYVMNSSGGYVYQRLLTYYNDRIFYAGNNEQDNFSMAVFDTTGKPLKIKDIKQEGSIMRAATFREGNLYALYKYYNGPAQKNVLLKTDTALNIQFMNEYEELIYGYPAGMGVADNGSIYVGGNYSYGGVNGSYYDAYIQKYQPDGSLGTCSHQSITADIIERDITTATPKFLPVPRTLQSGNIPVNLIPLENSQTVGALLCSSLPGCNSVKISGPALACSLTESFRFEARRNAGCNLAPLWVYDTAFTVLKEYSAASADFSFKKTGNTWIKVAINAGCSLLLDSILVQVQEATAIFSLGEDKVLCPGDSVLLNAGAGFNLYSWQDGSEASGFKADMPGKYYVTVSNACGNLFTDTLLIIPAIIP